MLDAEFELKQAGDYGRYQQLLFWLVFLPSQLPYGTHMYCQLVASWTPDHWCRIPRVGPDDEAVYLNIRSNMVKVYKNAEIWHTQCFVNHTLEYVVLSKHRKVARKRSMDFLARDLSECEHGWLYNRSWLGNVDSIVSEHTYHEHLELTLHTCASLVLGFKFDSLLVASLVTPFISFPIASYHSSRPLMSVPSGLLVMSRTSCIKCNISA
ncbi:beta-alanine transporter-like [Stegodyphus dumicola]|uniref:beta-alanine transporter-like n=1 Tax=Stegodyphus dumicola TaxID=202533 RepID=UPI0015B2E72F|nr:beta-alanine transporter-like [Stegodyphus dumicola]